MKLYRCMHDIGLMCHEQGRQLWHFLCPHLFDRSYVPLSCPGHNSKTLWNIFMKLHRCIHHNKTMCHEQGRQLLHFWFLNYFPLIRFHIVNPPGHYSQTVWIIFMKLYQCMHHTETMCHEQGRQLLHFWFLNYFPLTRFHIVNRVRAITPKLCPRLFEE